MTLANKTMRIISMDRELLRGPAGNPSPRTLVDAWTWGIHWARAIQAARAFSRQILE